MNDVHIDQVALDELLNSPDGPVGRFLLELSEQAATVARGAVRVRSTPSRSPRSNSAPPGFTLASIRPHVAWDSRGRIYGGVNAAFDPSIFLEHPAIQMHREYPFLTTGLYSLEGTF